MDLYVTLAVLCAALAHAIWNAFVKTGEDHLISITGVSIGATTMALFLLPFTAIPNPQSWPYIGASILLHTGYMISLSQAYRYSDFSSAYPIARGAAPVLVFGWSVVFLEEVLSGKEIVAVLGILIGIMVFSTRRLGSVVNDRKALLYALLTAVFIASYTVIDGLGARLSDSVNGYIVWMVTFETFPLLLYTYMKRGSNMFPAMAKNARPMLFGGAMAFAGYWIIIWAMTQAPIAIVAALRESSIIIAALIGAFYFKEPSGVRRIIAAGIVCLSVIILRL